MSSRFVGEEPLKPFEITAEWLYANTDYGTRRAFIRRNFLYFRDKDMDSPYRGNGVYKYRILERVLHKYAFRIVALKPH